jgi:uncharacterized protein
MDNPKDSRVLGKLVGNTGEPMHLKVALRSSFSAKRGEFVRIMHEEATGEGKLPVLGRITAISRNNMLFSEDMGEGLSEVTLLPGTRISGETVFGIIELIGFKEALTGEIRLPRRPLDPGAEVLSVDFDFLNQFYRFDPSTSIHIGNLVGYERGQNIVPAFLDVNTLATEHLAVLAMTGAGKSYTVGRIIERLVALHNATVIVLDPHGEYGRAFQGGRIQFANLSVDNLSERDQQSLHQIKDSMTALSEKDDRGIMVYTPDMPGFNSKYGGKNRILALPLDRFDLDEFGNLLPGLTEPQQRVLDAALRYWIKHTAAPRDAAELITLLTDRLAELRQWDELTEAESHALNMRSAAVVAIRLRRLLNDARSFYSAGMEAPTDIRTLTGLKKETGGRLVIVDLQGVSDSARQVIVAALSSEILSAAADNAKAIRPVFLVYEEGHNFAPANTASMSRNIIKKIASEGRKFGVGFAIISQRPSKLDADVTSQCNTLVVMRIKNPDDQNFIVKASDMLSRKDIDELPALSTGEALVCGRSIPAPLLIRIGAKALIHGGASPDVLKEWNP